MMSSRGWNDASPSRTAGGCDFQQQARSQLTTAGQPVTRLAVARRARKLLNQSEHSHADLERTAGGLSLCQGDIISIVDATAKEQPSKRSNARPGRSAQKSYSARTSEPRVAYPVRFPETTYDSLKAASAVTNTSVNRLVAEAVEHYLGSAKFRQRLTAARTAQEDAIRKLSGG